MDARGLVAALSIIGWVASCSGSTSNGTGGGSTVQAGGGTGGETSAGGGGSGGSAVGACCGVELPCPAGLSCAGPHNALAGNVGECQPTPTDGSCWNDLDCPADGVCWGQTTCECGDVCAEPSSPGTCNSMGEPCCANETDCGAGQICVGAVGFTKGRCQPAPSGAECYRDEDCPAGTCEGEELCPCGANCPTLPGTCSST